MWNILSQLFLNVDFLRASLRLSTPLVGASLGEIFSERAGVVNIGLEGMMLAGALGGVVGAYYTGNPWLGLLAGMIAGALLAAVHAFVSITLAADQVVSGAALNIGALGLTTFLYRSLFGIVERPQVAHFEPWAVPILSDIPFLGPVLFEQTPLVYVAYLLVPVAAFVLTRTEWGLALRAVGEHPEAADSLGISVTRTRYAMVILCGLLAGMAGTFFSLGQLYTFVEGMTGGRGFIALAVVIVGKWSPARAAATALFFGAADAIALRTQALNLGLPYHLLLAMPYALTMLVYLGVVGRTRAPSALGIPYVRD